MPPVLRVFARAALAVWLAGCVQRSSNAPPAGTESWPGHWPAKRCDHEPCPQGFMCRYFRGDAGVEGRCLLAPGYCFTATDCAPNQRCLRFGGSMGRCAERGF